MKKLLGIVVLGLLFISAPSYADDIRDFQIERISLGDSALDYFTIKSRRTHVAIHRKKKKGLGTPGNRTTLY